MCSSNPFPIQKSDVVCDSPDLTVFVGVFLFYLSEAGSTLTSLTEIPPIIVSTSSANVLNLREGKLLKGNQEEQE